MRSSLVLTIAVATVAAPAAAGIPYLEAEAGAGACGGSIGCTMTQDVVPPNPTKTSVAAANEGNTLVDGSYADAHASVAFGTMHLYADAYRAAGSDAQSSAQGWIHDAVDASAITPGLQTVTFVITGSDSTTNHLFGNYAQGYFNWDIYDSVTNRNVNGYYWESSDAVQSATLIETFTLPPGHGYYFNEYFDAGSYSSFGVVDVSDYSNTVETYLATPGGTPVVAQSGYNYAYKLTGGVPEPATWALMVAGFGVVGAARRRGLPPVAA